MPKSKGRKPKKKVGRDRRTGTAEIARPGQYAVGKLRGSEKQVRNLLLSPQASPDQMVELLLPLLWVNQARGMPANHCVDGCMTLHYAYAHLGIVAQPRAVDLVVSNQRTGQRTFYGRPDPYWSDTHFHGHCVLWLPGSSRFVDATVEQYPEVRRYSLGPIIGRTVMTSGDRQQPNALGGREWQPGGHAGVEREELFLLYTAVGHEFDNVVTGAKQVRQTTEEFQRAGENLAAYALTLLRIPEIIDRVRQAPYPRLHALLDLLGSAPATVDEHGNYRFALPNPDGTELALRLDEITLPEAPEAAVPVPRAVPVPHLTTNLNEVRAAFNDTTTEARAVLWPDTNSTNTETDTADETPPAATPVLIFEPLQAIGIGSPDNVMREAQAEAIIIAGFTRFLPDLTTLPPELPAWSLRHSTDGVELWDHGGLWAHAQLEFDDDWRAAATYHGMVQVIYGARTGVRRPAALTSAEYTDTRRAEELAISREQGIVATARIPWTQATAQS